ncbi:hypothetical protein EAE96_004543 [Botrytis aclada]|nr:hypothetical protein EAE96_004543 [Botrytis aclada]
MAEQDEDSEGTVAIPDEQSSLWTTKSHNETLSIGIEYAKGWKMKDAFRELLLNWADAIKQSFSISMEELLYVHKISATEHKITVHHPETRKILGFLNIEKDKGCLELCNYQSQLSRKALKMGWTDKDSKDDLSGKYGEGLKVAALVMLRDASYQIRITASGYYWRLRWKTNEKTAVDCAVSKIDVKDGNKKESAQNRDEIQFRHPNSWQDVSVKIGAVYGSCGSPLTDTHAKQLLNIYLYFNCSGSKEIIQTKYGAVILKEELKGRIYLKGALWKKAPYSHLYKYGYDFSQGQLDRDKSWSTSQLPDRLMEVWSEVVECGGKNIDIYLDLFRDTKQNWLDIKGASMRMSESVAKSLWKRLQEKNPQGIKFYHSKPGSDKTIQSTLKKEPVPISEELWKPLRKHTSLKTPMEYRREKFVVSDTVKIRDTPYCQSFLWTLRAAFSLYSGINFEIVFKNADDIDIDICLDIQPDKSRLLLHKSAKCVAKVENFTCEHIIDYLHERTLEELDRNKITTGLSIADEERGDSALTFEIRKCLKHMPRMIQIKHGHNNGELRVSWEDTEAVSGDKSSNDEIGDTANCGCPQKIVSSTASYNETIFEGLVSTESYFPKISRAKTPIAFFGFPPSSMKPTSKKPTGMLAEADNIKNENFPEATVLTPTSNTNSKDNLPVQTNRLYKALSDVTPCKSLRDRMSYNVTSVTSVEAQLEKSESCRSILRLEVEKSSSKIKQLESDFDSLRVEKESLSKQVKDAQPEKERLTKLCQLHEAQKLSNSIKLQAATDALGVKIGDLNVKIGNLKEELTKSRKSSNTQAAQLETSKKELDVMRSENAILQEKVSDFHIKSSVTVDLEEARITIDKLQKKHGEMKIDIGQLRADKEILEEQISQTNDQIERANTERDEAIVERNDAIAERDEAIVQKNKSVETERAMKSLLQSAWEKDNSSGDVSSHASGVKRDRSPDTRDQNGRNDGVGSGSRSVKKVKRETPKIIELD